MCLNKKSLLKKKDPPVHKKRAGVQKITYYKCASTLKSQNTQYFIDQL